MASEESVKLIEKYVYAYDVEVEGLSAWATEDLVRMAHMIDVELQERDHKARQDKDYDDLPF